MVCLLFQKYLHKKRWFAFCSKSIYTKRDGLLVVPKISTQKAMVCLLFQKYLHKKRWFAFCSKSIYTKREGLLVVPKISTRKEMVNCLLSIDIKSDGLLVLRVSTQKTMVCFQLELREAQPCQLIRSLLMKSRIKVSS